MFPSLRSRVILPSHFQTAVLLGAALFPFFNTGGVASAQGTTTIRIDASQPFSEPGPARYDEGSARSVSGHVLGVNSRYLTRDGKPWLPVMGEFHFSRFPQSQWEAEILKMKAAGVDIVAAYVIWIHHEEIQGQFDWKGERDLRLFAQLCAKHGLLLEPRIGPWDHAEVRNGGLPDWVLKLGAIRRNDPAYLASVRIWYGKIGEQLKGLLWKDGGPVIGIQLENEYALRGAGAGEEHILELKRMAIASGLDVPLYLVTGWDNAVVPQRAVIPVYGGGYPDAPWDGSITKLPAAEVYAFRFQSRVAANMGAMAASGTITTQEKPQESLPYLTAEIGAGIEDTYHRRPVILPDDIAAMFPVMLGSGVNLYGTYMFQGGENPEGKLTTLQESQATGYPNDLPIKSYDFQAPLSAYGQERASFRKMKVYQYFLNDFGADLAPMMVHAPETQPRNPLDFSVPRAAVRSNGDAGFIFFNNHVRGYAMPARPSTQFEIRLPGGSIKVPRAPIDIPSDAYFIWPFNLSMDGIQLRYSTAQLFTRQQNGGVSTFYFASVSGIPAEFAFETRSFRSIQASSGATVNTSGVTYVTGIKPGIDSLIELTSQEGKKLRLVVLSAQQAENAWKVKLAGQDHLLITDKDFYADPDAKPGTIWLDSLGSPRFDFSITAPSPVALHGSLALTKNLSNSSMDGYAATAKLRKFNFDFHPIQAAGDAPLVKIGPTAAWRKRGVAQAPSDAELTGAAKWSLSLAPESLTQESMKELSEIFLEIDYQGDVARLSANHHLLTDDFYNGQRWSIGLERFLGTARAGGFELDILPLRKDAPIYLETAGRPAYAPNGQVGRVDAVRLVPQYQLVISTGVR